MRAALSIILIALPCLSGCNLYRLTAFNGINETVTVLDNVKVRKKAVALAREAWLDHLTHIPENCPSEAYETGFIHGYADYLLHGGNCAPPAIPPNAFRRNRDMNPEGHLEIRAYYTGFAVGADAAKASGLRVWFQIPVSAPLPVEDRSVNYDAGREVEQTFPAEETLPEPKKSDPIEPKKEAPEGMSVKPAPFRPAARTRPAPGTQEPPELIPLPAAQPAEPEQIAPPLSPAAPSRPLPREFTLPIQGGPGAR